MSRSRKRINGGTICGCQAGTMKWWKRKVNSKRNLRNKTALKKVSIENSAEIDIDLIDDSRSIESQWSAPSDGHYVYSTLDDIRRCMEWCRNNPTLFKKHDDKQFYRDRFRDYFLCPRVRHISKVKKLMAKKKLQIDNLTDENAEYVCKSIYEKERGK